MSTRQRIEFCAKTAQKYAELGLVFAADAEVVPETLNMYQDTLAAGQLKIRIYTMNYNLTADALSQAQIKTGFGSSRLRIGPIKIFADGGMSNRTAAVLNPYLTPPHCPGPGAESESCCCR
jgi:predicted amidohydrolase YtcJ